MAIHVARHWWYGMVWHLVVFAALRKSGRWLYIVNVLLYIVNVHVLLYIVNVLYCTCKVWPPTLATWSLFLKRRTETLAFCGGDKAMF